MPSTLTGRSSISTGKNESSECNNICSQIFRIVAHIQFQHQDEQAIRHYHHAIELDSNHSRAHYGTAQIALRTGKMPDVTNVKGENFFLAHVAGLKRQFDVQNSLLVSTTQDSWGWQEWAQYARSQEKNIADALICKHS